jgi:hypothetical protein
MDLQKLIQQQNIVQDGIIGFTVEDTYPLLFFSYLLKYQQKTSDPIMYLDVNSCLEQDIKAQLETSFLGMKRIYWLGAIHQLPKKKAQSWLIYLQKYNGPNSIMFAISDELISPYKKSEQSIKTVAVPAQVNKAMFAQLFTCFVRELRPMDKRYIDKIFIGSDKIDIDVACVLMHYVQVMGSKSQEFFDSWLDQLVIPDKSLFKLSQYFFAQQFSIFFKMWSKIKDEYPEQFWISFWSEQIWRALFYCQMMQKRDIVAAKKIGYRLPFSFLQKDYRQHTVEHLQQAHQWLYDLDVSLKNGGSSIGLDSFFSRFFSMNT